MFRQEAIRPAAPPAAAPGGVTRKRDPVVPWLVGAVAVLVLAVLALGALAVAPNITPTANTALVDRNIAAWNTFDGDTIRSVYADDAYVFASSESTPVAQGIDEIVSLAQWGGFTIERLGPVTERGPLAWFPIHVSTTYDVAGDSALAVLSIEDGKITQHWVIWGQ